jgi:very-long-chain enoyl-CoA reductase
VPAGQPRKYPTGLGFGTVVCANYWYETLGVLGMVIMTGFDIGSECSSSAVARTFAHPSAIIYFVGAVFFMQLWAGQKFARYKREQDPKVFPGKRWKFFPPIY